MGIPGLFFSPAGLKLSPDHAQPCGSPITGIFGLFFSPAGLQLSPDHAQDHAQDLWAFWPYFTMSRPLNLEHLSLDLGKKLTDLIRPLDLLELSTFQRQDQQALQPDQVGRFGVFFRG